MDLVAEAGFEVESGARTMASLPNKVRMLVNLKLSEESARRDHETEKRKESRNVSQ